FLDQSNWQRRPDEEESPDDSYITARKIYDNFVTLTKLIPAVRLSTFSTSVPRGSLCALAFVSGVRMTINWPLAGATILPNVGGWIGQIIAEKNLKPWYESLKKPAWTPPNWLFGPVWTAAYFSIGYSSYVVWRDGGGFAGAAVPFSIYGVNLALNWLWTPIFFGAHKINWALYDIAALWISTIPVGVTFYQVNPIAGYFVIPYFAWTTFAAVLNYVIYRDNKQIPDATKDVEENK
ncbi:translocator protein, partial [Ooceraea biroi]|uniref:translocator protein n=1 Tax=Ooceraea biroi TaxID=2015173 RepID=UPI000F08309E